MFYRDCTTAYAAEVVREILDNCEPREALDMIREFLDNEINTDEIGNRI